MYGYPELYKERGRWRKQKNGLSQGSVFAPIIFNIYTNDQPIRYGTWSFIYADDLVSRPSTNHLSRLKKTFEEALDKLTSYYQVNSLRANLEKNTSAHLRCKLNIVSYVTMMIYLDHGCVKGSRH